MPELPEVEAPGPRPARAGSTDRAIARVDIAAFSALKTFDPPLSALARARCVDDVTRHGKFLDIDASGLHLVSTSPAAGWVRWRDEVPTLPPQAEQQVPAGRPGRTSTTAPGSTSPRPGTKKSLAMYVVRDPHDVPGIASLGPDPLDRRFTIDVLGGILAARRPRADQGRAAPPGHDRRHRQRLLRRAAARREDVAVQAGQQPRPTTSCRPLYDAIRDVLGDAVERSRGLAASELKGEKKSHLAVHGRTGQPCPVCGDTVREVSFADSSLQYCPTCQTGGKPLADRRMSRLLK